MKIIIDSHKETLCLLDLKCGDCFYVKGCPETIYMQTNANFGSVDLADGKVHYLINYQVYKVELEARII